MHCENVSDQDLIKRYLRGEEFALELIINRHKDRIFGYIVSKVKDAELADDIFQEVFVKVINTLRDGRYNEEGKFLPWVMRIAHNQVIDTFRKEQRSPLLRGNKNDDGFNIFDVLKSDEKNPDDVQAWTEAQSQIKNLIHQLPDEQYQVLYMRLYCDMSFKEIAEEKNVSINTCLGRMRYALINLRKLVEEKNLNLEMY
tara:strand:- start:1766 stop:2362 length:597 start_codon:yes stop_codon:yes gene_type:complete